MADDSGRVPEAGLQAERTYLAWQRTGLSFAAVGALLVHLAGGLQRPVAALPGIFGLATGAVILLRDLIRYRAMVSAAAGQGGAGHPGLAAAVAVAALVLGVSALVLLVTM